MALCPGGILRSFRDGLGRRGYHFNCPGCKEVHGVHVEGVGAWKFEGTEEAPTFRPSILVRSGHYSEFYRPGQHCWCDWNRQHPSQKPRFVCACCHSYVIGGRIEFLGDSTHALAGQTVALPKWEDLE